jgi:hypothetical protein
MRLGDELLQGAIDLHQLAAPSLYERITDDIGLALEARIRGMRGLLLKAHEQDTTGRAALVRRQVPGIMPTAASCSITTWAGSFPGR